MIRNVIILAVVASFLLASPTLAIQKKKAGQSKSGSKAKVEQKSKSSDSGEKVRNAAPPSKKETSSQPKWKPPKPPKRDRFKDENGDGLNDNIKKQHKVKVKKKKAEKESKRHRR